MRYALDLNDDKIEVGFSGQRAVCPGCKTEVTGKIYKEKKNHWAHLNSDCDYWYEPISEWHIKWQNYFPKRNREVTLFDENGKEFHRADILLDNKSVIEVQNSSIDIKEVAQRENFYNKNGLIWILNAENLIPKSSFENNIIPEKCEITISFCRYSYNESTTEKILKGLKERDLHPIHYFFKKNITEDYINYIFHSPYVVNPDSEEDLLCSSIGSLNWKLSRSNYDKEPPPFKIDINIISNKYKVHKYLYRAQWRSFIDQMNAPVFLDNVKNLHPDYLYWVQKEKIIEKKILLDRSLKHTKTADNNGYHK